MTAADRLETRFTRAFGLAHPVALAPMAFVSGGRLAAAVSDAGGLGLIGGGYGDGDWTAREWDAAGGAEVGVGFITWRLTPAVLEAALDRGPRAVMLSFGDPAPFLPAIRAARVPLILQVQDMETARAALDAGAAVVVAQGTEAGGHGGRRGTLTLVPEVADLIALRAPGTLLLAAGGIADGRGLAAALMLGADGVLVGTRFWAAAESPVPEGFHRAAVAADGDRTLRTRAVDAARGYDWPAGFDIRVMRSAFSDRWHDDPGGLARDERARAEWASAQAAGDAMRGSPVAGEAVGLVRAIAPAAAILGQMSAEAARCLARGVAMTGTERVGSCSSAS
ncbi:MAG: NAD(P)H-dependent flavin oxidoreductase [Gemmobacter sp.]